MSKKSVFKFIFYTTTAIAAANQILNKLNHMNNTFSKNNLLTYKSKFGDIKYRKNGTGDKPLLLIHNLSVGDNLYEWKYLTDYLSNDYTIYSLNLLGCGNSDKNNLLYTNYMYVKLIHDFINDIICSKTNIVTSGNANRIAVMTEVYEKESINKIIMINPAPFPTVKYSELLSKCIQIPIFGTFLYNILFSKKKSITLEKEDFRLEEYLNICYDSIHYHNNKSRFLYASIIQGKTDINYQRAIHQIDIETYTYTDHTCSYPHIQTPEKVAEFISSNL